jgi:hypothetical protein
MVACNTVVILLYCSVVTTVLHATLNLVCNECNDEFRIPQVEHLFWTVRAFFSEPHRADIGPHSQCQIGTTFPNFKKNIPNFKKKNPISTEILFAL